ncbi:TFIIA-alpha and beta-like factor isoform X2 [Rhinatrema bivittatum]|uniref:TFIIA-alpha and beta-like factor isoform X2 n=1 Tax=Rhinatrema bivittatum TaxID=194408 RepID=UPI00112AE7B1|nr:TFIIA-alpha and beta-like factor isoform X2 [Rhinatrema bivittatum]
MIPKPKLYKSIIEDVIDGVSDLFVEEGVDEQVLKELKQLWESKVMQSKATEGFFRENSSAQFVLQLPQNLHQTLQTSAPLIIPPSRSIQNYTTGELGTSGSSTFTLPPGINYPIHVPAGVTLQTASGHLYKVNVPVMVTQAPGGPRILQQTFPQIFQPFSQSAQTSVAQMKASSRVTEQNVQQQESLSSRSSIAQETVERRNLDDFASDALKQQSSGVQQQISMNMMQNHQRSVLEEYQYKTLHTMLFVPPQSEVALDNKNEPNTSQVQLPNEVGNSLQQQVPDNIVELFSLDDGPSSDENVLGREQSTTTTSEGESNVNLPKTVPSNIEIIQIDGTGNTSSDEEIVAVRDVEENEFLGIIDTEDLKALEEDSGSDEDSTSNSSDDEGDQIDAIEEDPLNSGDDVSEQEVPDLFDTDNVIVCQYDKIHRSKNKWKFYLKDGVMSFGGKDYVFSKAIGEAEW